MWERRKELYICASRATAFLFFILPQNCSVAPKLRKEIEELVSQLSSPHNEEGFSRTWRFDCSAWLNEADKSIQEATKGMLRGIFGDNRAA